MSSRAQHYRQAERLLADADHPDASVELLTEAQVHAQLACVPLSVYNEYLDLQYTEVLREDVVNTPPPDSRDYLIVDEDD